MEGSELAVEVNALEYPRYDDQGLYTFDALTDRAKRRLRLSFVPIVGFALISLALPLPAPYDFAAEIGIWVGVAFGLWRVFSARRWEAFRVTIGEDHVSAYHKGVREWQVGFHEIRRVICDPKGSELVLQTTGGERKIPGGDLFDFLDVQRVFRHLRSANPAIEIDPPELCPVEEQDFECREVVRGIPRMSVRKGRTYRYADPGALRVSGECFLPFTIIFANIFTCAVPIVHGHSALTPFIWGVIVLMGLLIWLFLPKFLARVQLYRSRNDRFEVSQDGMWVQRGDRKWRVKYVGVDSRWPQSLKIEDGVPLKFRGPRGTYYFDPRYIEEDK